MLSLLSIIEPTAVTFPDVDVKIFVLIVLFAWIEPLSLAFGDAIDRQFCAFLN